MSDRLEEIKDWLETTKTKEFGGIRPSDKARYFIEWLISELEKCRKEVKDWKRYEKAAADDLALEQVKVDKQRRHRKWALKQAKEKQALWRNYCGEVSEQMDEAEYQKRKRKWALVEAKKWLDGYLSVMGIND